MATALKVENASFNYGDRIIFADICFEVAAGEILSMLGPNGCGKTTLLRCISGSLRLKEGHVSVNGRDAVSLNVVKLARSIGFVFQEHTVLFPYSVLDVVRMGRAPHLGLFSTPSRRDTAIAIESLKQVGILHLAKKPYSQISGGERQLALIARALTQEPEILLLDEPTSHLDFGNQTLVLQTVRRLAQQSGLAVIMTTHFPNHAILVSAKVALMKGGHFIALGAPAEVITEPSLANLYGVPVRLVTVDDAPQNESRFVLPMMRPE